MTTKPNASSFVARSPVGLQHVYYDVRTRGFQACGVDNVCCSLCLLPYIKWIEYPKAFGLHTGTVRLLLLCEQISINKLPKDVLHRLLRLGCALCRSVPMLKSSKRCSSMDRRF